MFMLQAMTLEEVTTRIKAVNGEKVRIVSSTYKGFKKRARFIDRDFGEWEAFVYAVCRGQRHPDRARTEARIPLGEFQARLAAVHGNVVLVESKSYTMLTAPCWFVDRDFGKFRAYPQNVLKGKGHPKRAALARTAGQREDAKSIAKRVYLASAGKVELIGPYEGMLRKCLFRDIDFGEFKALPANVIHKGTRHPAGANQRRRAAFLVRFGVPHHMQDDAQFKKFLRSSRRRFYVKHWQTRERLICIGTWERDVVRKLNKDRVHYLWQPKTFRLPNGKTYRPDLLLVTSGTWVEIKSWWRDAAKEKWEWFHGAYPNSELWDRERLHEMGIL